MVFVEAHGCAPGNKELQTQLEPVFERMERMLAFVGWLLIVAVIFAGMLLLYWRFRSPSDLNIARSLNLETWTGVPADEHHSNTDLFKFKGQYIMVHASSPWHFASARCRLVVRSSKDGKEWRILSDIRLPGEDVRDATIAEINGKLFIYFFPNVRIDPWPYTTFYCYSDDAVTWSSPEPLSIVEWLLWRPRTIDGKTFYAPAYTREQTSVTLFKAKDGINWSEVSAICNRDKANETDVIIRPDGTMIGTLRMEMSPGFWGHHPEGHTVIAMASPPIHGMAPEPERCHTPGWAMPVPDRRSNVRVRAASSREPEVDGQLLGAKTHVFVSCGAGPARFSLRPSQLR